MFLYNVTLIMEEAVHEQWLALVKQRLVPEIMESDFFTSSRVLRVIDSPNEGMTYCLQFFAETRSDIDRYLAELHPGVQQVYNEKFGQQVLSFATIMEYVL